MSAWMRQRERKKEKRGEKIWARQSIDLILYREKHALNSNGTNNSFPALSHILAKKVGQSILCCSHLSQSHIPSPWNPNTCFHTFIIRILLVRGCKCLSFHCMNIYAWVNTCHFQHLHCHLHPVHTHTYSHTMANFTYLLRSQYVSRVTHRESRKWLD